MLGSTEGLRWAHQRQATKCILVHNAIKKKELALLFLHAALVQYITRLSGADFMQSVRHVSCHFCRGRFLFWWGQERNGKTPGWERWDRTLPSVWTVYP